MPPEFPLPLKEGQPADQSQVQLRIALERGDPEVKGRAFHGRRYGPGEVAEARAVRSGLEGDPLHGGADAPEGKPGPLLFRIVRDHGEGDVLQALLVSLPGALAMAAGQNEGVPVAFEVPAAVGTGGREEPDR